MRIDTRVSYRCDARERPSVQQDLLSHLFTHIYQLYINIVLISRSKENRFNVLRVIYIDNRHVIRYIVLRSKRQRYSAKDQ